jgi:hypothetical protein
MQIVKKKSSRAFFVFPNRGFKQRRENLLRTNPGVTDETKVYVEGITAGVIGASIVAIWFFILDVIEGRPFYTPTTLGTALFSGREALSSGEHLHPFTATVMYTWVHLLVFAVIGVVASGLLNWVEKNPSVGFGTLLFFVFFVFFFVVSSFIFASPILGALAWPAVLGGNLLAAGGMGLYLWYRHPKLVVSP